MARAAGVTVEWLATGEGPMCPGESTAAGAPVPEGYVSVPVHEVRAGAGADITGDEGIELQWLSPRLAQVLGVRRGAALDGLFVEGDSMQPELGPEDVILIDRRKPVFTGEALYVLRLGQVLVVKRVQPLGKGLVRLISANAAFSPLEFNLNEGGAQAAGAPFGFIGKVVWIGKRV